MDRERTVLAFDTEASGHDGRICQISYILMDANGSRGVNRYFSVEEMDPRAEKIHGLSKEKLKILSGGVTFQEAAEEIWRDFSGADMWIGHNAASDVGFLRGEWERAGLSVPDVPILCTMKSLRLAVSRGKYLRGGRRRPKPPSLRETMDHYGVTDEAVKTACLTWFGGGDGPHDARFDAAAALLCALAAQEAGDIPLFLDATGKKAPHRQ